MGSRLAGRRQPPAGVLQQPSSPQIPLPRDGLQQQRRVERSGRVARPRDRAGVLPDSLVPERRIIERFIHRQRVPSQSRATAAPFGERVADRVAAFGGSWTFIFLAVVAIIVWMPINAVLPKEFDPYPYILLNLVLSCLAALQAPVIMMSQNRQAARDRLDTQHDYESQHESQDGDRCASCEAR
jgi:uncharacterized membrane protein